MCSLHRVVNDVWREWVQPTHCTKRIQTSILLLLFQGDTCYNIEQSYYYENLKSQSLESLKNEYEMKIYNLFHVNYLTFHQLIKYR